MRAGAPAAAVEAMRAHRADAALLTQGVALLRNLASERDGRKAAVFQAGAASVIPNILLLIAATAVIGGLAVRRFRYQ